jgi:hypothetical protein
MSPGEGAMSPAQLAGVRKLLSPPPPSQVAVAALAMEIGRPKQIKASAIRRANIMKLCSAIRKSPKMKTCGQIRRQLDQQLNFRHGAASFVNDRVGTTKEH